MRRQRKDHNCMRVIIVCCHSATIPLYQTQLPNSGVMLRKLNLNTQFDANCTVYQLTSITNKAECIKKKKKINSRLVTPVTETPRPIMNNYRSIKRKKCSSLYVDPVHLSQAIKHSISVQIFFLSVATQYIQSKCIAYTVKLYNSIVIFLPCNN